MKVHFVVLSLVAALFCTLIAFSAGENGRLDGHWKLVPEKSGSIDPWSQLGLDITIDGSRVTIVKRYDAGNALDRRVDSMTVNSVGSEEVVSVPPGRWLGEVSMGVYYGPNTKRRVSARTNDSRNGLQVDARETLQTAQGAIEVAVKEIYTLAPDGSSLILTETRSTRTSGPPLTYTFARVIQ